MAYFEPWIGKNYSSGGIFKYKILAVGESHYCGEFACPYKSKCGVLGGKIKPKCHRFTDRTINIYLDSNGHGCGGWGRTYKKFTKVLTGGRESSFGLRDVWNSIAFYNFIQSAVLTGPRIPFQNKEVFEDCIDIFNSVVSELRPDFIVVWGDKTWQTLKNSSETKHLRFLDNDQVPIRRDSEPLVLMITHPASSKFKYDSLTPLFSGFLK